MTTSAAYHSSSSLTSGRHGRSYIMSSRYATIKIKPATRLRLAKFGDYNDTLDGILNRLMDERESCHCRPLEGG
jgi:hypothetical protein